MFGTILLSAVTLLHIYVFWRAASVPLVRRKLSTKQLCLAGLALWACFFLGRKLGHGGAGVFSASLELLGMNWMAALFLLAVCFLAADILTGFGLFLPRITPHLRSLALAAGGILSATAFVQGLRPPVMVNHEVRLEGLPAGLDGTVIAVLSDLHLGSLLGENWLSARITQVRGQKPDMVVLLGDNHEGHGSRPEELVPVMSGLSAPMGVWAVSGNHESHGRRGETASFVEKAGFTVLDDSWTEIRPGLVLAGVRYSRRVSSGSIERALAGRPPGATVFLSHAPDGAEKAAAAGAGLMLSGHTHGGQIWPFGYLVRRRYPLLAGRYDVDGMTVIVSRGTGTWGPCLRLWLPGEILRVTLRSGG